MELALGRRLTPTERRRYDKVKARPDGSYSRADSDFLASLRRGTRHG
jgi:hypothetical protein